MVAPGMGAWIEIADKSPTWYPQYVAPGMGAWIEILYGGEIYEKEMSLPVWERELK